MQLRHIVTVLFLTFAAHATAQPSTNPAGANAAALYAKQDWRAAADAYEALHRQEPDKFVYPLRLGVSRIGLHEYQKAVDALNIALELTAPEGFTRYNLACAQARLGKSDDAMGNLKRATETGFGRADQVEADEDLASLHDDPRFKQIIDDLHHPTKGRKGADAMDHWIGEWDVFVNAQRVGYSVITRTLDGYGVEEHWHALQGGGRGQSFFVFDAPRGQWKQLWMDDRGWLIEKTGTPIDNGIRFEGSSYQPDGSMTKSRESITRNDDGSLRQFLEDWDEESKTWQATFDGKYVRVNGH